MKNWFSMTDEEQVRTYWDYLAVEDDIPLTFAQFEQIMMEVWDDGEEHEEEWEGDE